MIRVDERYVHGAAYHEAAHIVIAAVQGMALRERGLMINELGGGFAAYSRRQPDGSTDIGPGADRERTIIATAAGFIAHGIFCPSVVTGDPNASDDCQVIDALLLEKYLDPD